MHKPWLKICCSEVRGGKGTNELKIKTEQRTKFSTSLYSFIKCVPTSGLTAMWMTMGDYGMTLSLAVYFRCLSDRLESGFLSRISGSISIWILLVLGNKMERKHKCGSCPHLTDFHRWTNIKLISKQWKHCEVKYKALKKQNAETAIKEQQENKEAWVRNKNQAEGKKHNPRLCYNSKVWTWSVLSF